MDFKKTETTFSNWSIQDYLSVGYLYLLILGISREVVYYGFLDINILMYSSILDVLLSPIAFLSKKPFIFISLLILPFLIYYFFDKRDRKKNPDKVIPKGYMNNEALMATFLVFALGLSGFFFGTGIGSGISESRKIKKGDFKLKHQITFMDNKKSNVRLIGSNSQFVFYVLENNNHVTISPIQGNVKAIDVNDE